MGAFLLELPTVNGGKIMLNESNIEAVIPYEANGKPYITIISTTGQKYSIDMSYSEFQEYRHGLLRF